MKYRNQALTYGTSIDPDLQLYDHDDLQAMGYGSRATIWRLRRKGEFPEPVVIGGLKKWTGKQLRELHTNKGCAA